MGNIKGLVINGNVLKQESNSNNNYTYLLEVKEGVPVNEIKQATYQGKAGTPTLFSDFESNKQITNFHKEMLKVIEYLDQNPSQFNMDNDVAFLDFPCVFYYINKDDWYDLFADIGTIEFEREGELNNYTNIKSYTCKVQFEDHGYISFKVENFSEPTMTIQCYTNVDMYILNSKSYASVPFLSEEWYNVDESGALAKSGTSTSIFKDFRSGLVTLTGTIIKDPTSFIAGEVIAELPSWYGSYENYGKYPGQHFIVPSGDGTSQEIILKGNQLLMGDTITGKKYLYFPGISWKSNR